MKTATAQAKLDRVNEQIVLAQSEVERIDDEIEGIENGLTTQLAKLHVDDEAVATLEAKRAALTTSRTRLQARVSALQGTLPEIKTALNEAVLTDEIAAHKELIAQINNDVERWEVKAQEVTDLAAIADTIRADRRRLIDIEGHIRFLAAVTGADMPELSDTGHVSNAVILNLRSGLRAALETEASYYKSTWDERADALAQSARETVTA